eukprot:TRINITY_DN10366_c0_g1_i1.p1 TRINITY_DN10366_c0_g1~~TRINITY_DN10366_c0_g1_i1.p1  ORF type:complete len:139 (-),score=26.56 TRINITY_DN10366_c0_g1_i1:13-429(-)
MTGIDTKKLKAFLKISVVCAKNLPAMDANGKSDPYVAIEYGKTHYRTNTKRKTLNPEWKEDFVLPVMENQRSDLLILVKDWDRLGRNELIGLLVFKISKLNTDGNTQWYTLNPAEKLKEKGVDYAGEIKLGFLFKENK